MWSRPLPVPISSTLEIGPAVTIAVIADTHGRPHPLTVERLVALKPDAILHAGDVGDARCLEPIAAVAPLWVVRGNIDGHDWPDVRLLELREGGAVRLRLLLTHIAVARLAPSRVALQAAAERGAELIVCGHSHVPFLTAARRPDGGEVVLFNPGSAGPRRFHLPIVLGALTLEAGRLSARHIDVETGLPWRPA